MAYEAHDEVERKRALAKKEQYIIKQAQEVKND